MADETEKTAGGEAPAADKVATANLFSHSGFTKLFAGSFCGALADRLYQYSLIGAANVIFAGTASENTVGNLQIVATIPLLIFYPLSGSMIDTFDRRKLLTVVKGLKIFTVLLFLPLLWHVVDLNHLPRDPDLVQRQTALWPWCLALVVVLNIITVPFGPARAAAIPDVVPEEKRSVAASLIATTGLIALLLGSFIGGVLARTDVLGPALTNVVASAVYLVSALLFLRLPDAVAVPGNKRQKTPADGAAPEVKKEGMGEYIKGLIEGFAYCIKKPSVIALIFFESLFWTVGSAFYILILFYARTILKLTGDDQTTFFGIGLGVAGVGLFGGAIGVGRICRTISPIFTYFPALLLIGLGLHGVFHTGPETAVINGAVVNRASYAVYAMLFGLGLGGGMMLGRVDADVLAIAEERVRGRIFAIKAMAFAATILATILTITGQLNDVQKQQLSEWMPRVMFMLLPVAFIFSWMIDVAIWRNKKDIEPPGALHRFGFGFCRVILRIIVKILFRFEVQGKEKIPTKGPVILVANHASFIDPIFLGCAAHEMVQFIMYASYYNSFALPIFRFLHTIPVDEKSQTAALKAGMRALKKGGCIGLFPEGHVSEDGKLQPAELGFLFMAQRSGATVVPVAIKGNREALPRGAAIPHMVKVTMMVGEPFTVSKDLSREQLADMAQKIMEDWAQKLGLEPPKK